ncbi:MAG: transposase family protein [Chloroflexi bacterium]|nr:transposase family protein [Chloroflexota bacterium]
MTDRDQRALEIASFRYRIIADAAEAVGADVSQAIAASAERTYVHPDGQSVCCSARTLWRWLGRYKAGGLNALRPTRRTDAGTLRALSSALLERAIALRHENQERPTKTVIDILERLQVAAPGSLKRSTLDRHFARRWVSRRTLHRLGIKTFQKILTTLPLALVSADFHHGPYVRMVGEEKAQRALLLAFIDHFSRYLLESRYYLHEDFAALRFGFRRLLVTWGVFDRLYIDNGPSFHSGRFHAACKNEVIDIEVVHSKAYTSEGRGVCERANRTFKEQFESEARNRDELLTLAELNAAWEAWVAERYHRDMHSETGEAPFERFKAHAELRAAPDLARLDELLRLRTSARVHKKWSTVEVRTVRYVVDPALRGRAVHVLCDPFDPEYVLIEFDGRILQRAYPQKAGAMAPQPAPAATPATATDYLALLRRDYEARTQAELSALNLSMAQPRPELAFADLKTLLTTCRGQTLSVGEQTEVSAAFRKLRPIDPDSARRALDGARRRLGAGLHLRVYLEVLETSLIRNRAKERKSS